MPAGVVRVYQADSKGGTQFVGEDRIAHTPKDEDAEPQDRQRVRRRLRAQADRFSEDRGASVYELEYEITLRNHKAHARSRWKSTSRSAARGACCGPRTSGRRPTPGRRGFTVPVAVDGTAVLKYRVRVTY